MQYFVINFEIYEEWAILSRQEAPNLMCRSFLFILRWYQGLEPFFAPSSTHHSYVVCPSKNGGWGR